MDGSDARSREIVIHDSRPFEVMWEVFFGVVFVSWAIRRPLVGLPLLVSWFVLLVVLYRRPRRGPVANADGITGLRLRVPRADRRTWYGRREVVRTVTPWDQIESIGVKSSPTSLSGIRFNLTGGREADLDVRTVTRRGLGKLAADIERLRPTATQ